MGVLRNFVERKRVAGGRLATTVAIGAVIAAGLVAAPAAAQADTSPVDANLPSTVTTDALPTVQVEGIVWDQVVVGNTVYAAGQFTKARPAGAASGTNEVTRNNVIAYDIRTGAMLPWAPDVDGQVRSIAASPDGKRLYIGGDFLNVNSTPHSRVAAFDIPSGNLVSSWSPSANSSVRAIAATDSTVYFSGTFGRVSSNDRSRAAAVSASGALLPWAPVLDNRGNDIVISADGSKVALAGHFTTVNGSSNPGYGMALVDGTTAALLPFAANGIVRNGGPDAAIWSLSTDGDNIYGTGYHFGGGGNLEGIFKTDWATGALNWVEDCHGDTYSAYAANGVVYGAGHAHYCGSVVGGFPQSDPWTFYRGIAFKNSVERTTPYGLGAGYHDWGGNPAPRMLHWYPTFNTGKVSGANQGPWNVTGNGDYVVMGGEFTRVNNQIQQGLVRFATSTKAPNTDGPRLSGSNWVPSASAIAEGTMRISWPLNWDRDNEYLEYKLIRDGVNASPIYTTTARSKSPDWGLPGLSFIDKGVAQGTTHTYRVRAEDAHGNVAWSNIITATVDGVGPLPEYSSAVLADAPVNYWPLNDSGATSLDWAGPSDLAVRAGVTRGVDGALTPSTIPASSFNGTDSGFATTQRVVEGPQTFSIEAWFKTTTTSGGKIVGFGNSQTGTSSSYDRHVYMDPSGRVNFGVYPNAERVVSSAQSYNDGAWHQVVASLDPVKGMELYVDGVKVAQRADTTSAQSYTGYWRVGGDSTWSGSQFFNGSIDEVAIYNGALSRTQVQAHYIASGRTLEGSTPPSDAYGAAVYASEPSLFWRLNETTGSTTADASGSQQRGTYYGAHTKATEGALSGVASTSSTFEGGQLISQSAFVNPTVYSTEAWFKTTSTSGGKIIGFGNNGSGNSGSYDRHVYMTNTGQLVFGAYTGQTVTLTTDKAYNNGQWHHVVATQGPDGMRLYVDGTQVGSNGNSVAENYTGYWHVGGDVTWGPGNWEFLGSIDEVAVYPTVLSPSVVADHYSLGREGAPANQLPTASFAAAVTKLAVAVDGSASTDPDGSIVSYDWNWGDDTAHGVGATATHTYAAAGTYTVTLTVTDDRSGTATKTESVVAVANVAPTAAFTATTSPLKVAVDASGSADSDGTISSYDWNWGDDSTHGTGATATHTYASAGTYTVTLTVVDNDGASTSKTESVVIPAVPANVAPTAAFTTSANGLTAAADGTGSTDSDGTIASYDWNWGDQSTHGVGATATHTYAAAGTYTVTLTVTDNAGATGTVSHPVTVEAPPTTGVLASDTFGRTSASGLGTADQGGSWSLANAASNFAVDGTGVFRLTAGGALRTAYLTDVASTKTDLSVDVTFDTVPAGGSVFAQAIARRIGADDYRARITVATNGATAVQLLRSGTVIATQNLSGLTVTPGTTLTLRVEASGTAPTTLRAKVWKAGTAEPSAWQVTTTDSTAALQANGQVGLAAYAGSGVSNLPYLVRFDNLVAKTPGTVSPPANVNPVASFQASANALALSVDGSASTDPDGSIAAYAWDFGDGGRATGATASHTYGAAGTYTVTLQVTDDRGATNTTTKSVTVSAPTPPNPNQPLVSDEFDRTGTNGWGTAAAGGAWTYSTTSLSGYSLDGASANIAVAGGSTRAAYLASVSSASTDLTSTMTLSQLPVAGTVYNSFIARRVGTEDYRARVVVGANGAVQLQLQRTSTTLNSANIAGLTLGAGEELQVRVQAFGTSPTTVRAKVWKTGTTEPAAWQVTTTDATAALQAAGHVGLASYLGAGTSNVPYTVSFGNIKVVPVP